MDKAAIYTRVSSPGQATADAASLEAQEQIARSICERQGWEVYAHYQDAGKSATRDNLENRPAMLRLLADAAAGKFSHLAVYHLDRLARQTEVAAEIALGLRRAKVSIHTQQGPADLEAFGGRLLYYLNGLMAEEEAHRIRERCDNGRRTYAKRGEIVFWQEPFGYKWLPGDLRRGVPNRLEAVAEELATVRLVYDLATKRGLTIRGVTAEANRRGHRTRMGKAWHPAHIAEMLSDPRYCGRWRVWAEGEQEWFAREDLIPEVAVTEKQWQRAQKVRAHHKARTRRPMLNAHLLNGFLVCGECGSRMIGHQIHDAPVLRYYVCSKKKANEGKACRARYVPAEPLEGQTMLLLSELAEHPEAARAYAEATREDRLPSLREEAARIGRAMVDAEARLDRLVIGYEQAELTGDEVGRRRPRILADIAAWRERASEIGAQIADAEAGERAAAVVAETLSGLEGRMADLTLQDRRALLAQLDFRMTLSCQDWGVKSTERCYQVDIAWAGDVLLPESATADIVTSPFKLPM